jgi:hypothetical protein
MRLSTQYHHHPSCPLPWRQKERGEGLGSHTHLVLEPVLVQIARPDQVPLHRPNTPSPPALPSLMPRPLLLLLLLLRLRPREHRQAKGAATLPGHALQGREEGQPPLGRRERWGQLLVGRLDRHLDAPVRLHAADEAVFMCVCACVCVYVCVVRVCVCEGERERVVMMSGVCSTVVAVGRLFLQVRWGGSPCFHKLPCGAAGEVDADSRVAQWNKGIARRVDTQLRVCACMHACMRV